MELTIELAEQVLGARPFGMPVGAGVTTFGLGAQGTVSVAEPRP